MTSHTKIHLYTKKNGKLLPHVGYKPLREVIIDYVSYFKEDTDIEVIIRKHKSKRSNSQNRYMYWVWNFVSEHYGYEPNDVKDLMKDKYLPKEEINVGGVIKQRSISTASLNTEQQELFMERVRKFWLDFDGFIIPLPNEIEED